MDAMELARRLAGLGQSKEACQAYTLALEEAAPEEKMEAALYILQFGSGDSYKISYTVFRDLYNRGFCKEDVLSVMDGAFYAPNVKLIQTRYRKNCALLEKYPYIFRKDFIKFEDLPIRFYPYDDNSYTPYYVREERFGDYINFRDAVIRHNFFKDLENPILAKDIYSQYELEYLRDNVRRSEDVARENHVYLHYSSWAEFCAYLTCLNMKPLLEEKKIVFLFEDELDQYPIDFKVRFNIDYSQMNVKPVGIREITRLIWHGQLSSHNGGDFFNEVFDAHPNLIAMPSVMMSNIEDAIGKIRGALDSCESLAQLRGMLVKWEDPRLIAELYHSRARTDKDILVALYLDRQKYSQFLDKNSRIVPALFFQPHFPNIIYSLKVDAKDRTVLHSKEYDNLCDSPILAGFKYIKTFIPMRRFTTSHGASVRFMDASAAAANQRLNEGEKAGKITIVTDAVAERVLNRSFMVDRQDRICRDSVIVRFEDGKLNPKATFTALAAFLDLPYNEETMTYCSLGGKPVRITDDGYAPGFTLSQVYKTYDEFANSNERIFIEYFLRDAYQYYGYDLHYYDGEPMTKEQVKALVNGFDTIDSYIRKTWKLVFDNASVSMDGEIVEQAISSSVRTEMLEDHMKGVQENRMSIVDALIKDLRFVGKNGQPLYMMPMLKLDPALLENPIYH